MIAKIKNLLFSNSTGRQTILKNTAWLFIGQIGGRLIRTVIVIYSARVLGAAEYGIFSYALAIAGFVTIFSDFGISAILTRESVKNPNAREEYFSTALAIKSLFVGLSTILVFCAVPFVVSVDGVNVLLPMIALMLIFDTLREFSYGVFRSLEKMEREAYLDILTNAAIAIFGFLALYISVSAKSLSIGYTAGSAIGFFASMLLLIPYFKNFFKNLNWKLGRQIIVLAWPLGMLGVLGSLMINTDLVMLGWWRNAAQIGYYAAAQKPILLLYILPTLIASAVFPSLARLAQVNNERFRYVLEKSLTATIAIALPVVATGSVLAGGIMSWLYNPTYAQAIPAFGMLLVTLMLVFPSMILSNALFAFNKQRKFLLFAAIGAISNAFFNYLLIPKYGIEGSAVATTISQILTLALVWHQMKATIDFSLSRHLLRIIIASVLSAGAAYGLQTLGLPVLASIALSAAIYLAVLWALKEPIIHEIKEIVSG